MKYLFFDLDDTLFDFKKAEAAAITKTLRQLAFDPTPEMVARYSVINKMHWERLERKEITREQVLYGRFQMLLSELHSDCDPLLAQNTYENLLAQGHYFIPGAEELLCRLYGTYKLYLVSNGTKHVQDGRLKSAGISHYFDEIFISQSIGFDKPDKRFFTCCFERIPDFDASAAMIIGDSLTSDILGGKNAGIATCWFNPSHKNPDGQILPDYEIFELAEIPELLQKLG